MAYTTIDDPSVYFQSLLYTGNATGSRALTNDGNSDLQPDWLWIKQRNAAKNHNVWDSTRGVTKQLRTNLTNAEASNTANDNLVSLDSDGFTLGDDTDSVGVNENSQTYVAWQWKANGGTTTTNDASATSVGTIDSVYQANTAAGFSIVTYTGAGGNQTVAHGLGVTPEVIFIKLRSGAGDWTSYHSVLGAEKFMRLNDTNAVGDQATYFQDTAPTSTVFSVGNAGDVNTSSGTHVAYCFKSIKGYSKFGSYLGNADNNGTFVYTGFSPAWLMIKRTDSTQQWNIHDNKRKTYNQDVAYVFANLNNAEATSSNLYLDFLSNGFRLRNGDDAQNNGTYLYLAFAHQPFVTSSGVPTTAK